jgi:uncharacterized protein
MMKRLFCAIAIFTAVAAAAARGADDLTANYDYDRTQPLHAYVREVSRGAEVTQYHVTYHSANGEQVPALLNIPLNAKAPYPCIIAQHGYSSRKEDNVIFALTVARLGYAMFSIDAQYHGERKVRGKDIFSIDIGNDTQAIVQTIIDLRRAIDYLQSRKDIDPDRIGYVGVSMGAILGTIFSGVDSRVKAPILIVGGGGWRTIITLSQIGPAITMRNHLREKNLQADTLAVNARAIDPLNFVWRISPRPVLFINGKRDRLVPVESNILLHNMASEPKTIVWFDGIEGEPTGHIPPINDILQICTEWWKKNI